LRIARAGRRRRRRRGRRRRRWWWGRRRRRRWWWGRRRWWRGRRRWWRRRRRRRRRRSARGHRSKRDELADPAAWASPRPSCLATGGPCIRLDVCRALRCETREATRPADRELLGHTRRRSQRSVRRQSEETDNDVVLRGRRDRRRDGEPAPGRERTAVRIHRHRFIDSLEIEDRSCSGGRSGPGPAVTRRLGGGGDLVVERLRQGVVVGGATVAPDQVPTARRSDRDVSRQTGVDGSEQNVTGSRRRRP
jgi:hypothetical protein